MLVVRVRNMEEVSIVLVVWVVQVVVVMVVVVGMLLVVSRTGRIFLSAAHQAGGAYQTLWRSGCGVAGTLT